MLASGIAMGAVKFSGLVADPVAAQIVGWSAFVAFVMATANAVLHGSSSAQPGPWVSPAQPSPPVPPLVGKMALFLAAGLLGALLVLEGSGGANADPLPIEQLKVIKHAKKVKSVKVVKRAPVKITTPDQLIQKIIAWATKDGDADLSAAIQMATTSKNSMTLACWQNLQIFVKNVEALSDQSLPALHLAVDVEVASELEEALQPNAPIMVSCSPVASGMAMSGAQMVTGIVTGALAIGRLPLPVIP